MEEAKKDIKFRVLNARSIRAASIDANTGEFFFDATKVVADTQQEKTIDVTIEAIGQRGERRYRFLPNSRFERTEPDGKHRDSKNSRRRMDDTNDRRKETDGDEW